MARNICQDGKPRITTLFALRSHIWYWLAQSNLGLARNIPTNASYYRRTTETLQVIKKQGGFNRKAKKKTFMGLPEFVQLIEYDVSIQGATNSSCSDSSSFYTPRPLKWLNSTIWHGFSAASVAFGQDPLH